MRQLFLFLVTCLAVALFSYCKVSQPAIQSSEAIEFLVTFWHVGKEDTNITAVHKVWYQDSIGITEIRSFVTDEKIDGTIARYTKTTGYRLVDLKNKWVYEYNNFQDTATIRNKYAFNDSTVWGGGWNFKRHSKHNIDNFYSLSDTVINNIAYKRYRKVYSFNDTKFTSIELVNCDKRRTHFQLDTSLSNKIGCTVVSRYTYPTAYPRAIISEEVRFISEKIPDSVLKVFAAWKRNETLYPVQ
jgi:hypothetical protein